MENKLRECPFCGGPGIKIPPDSTLPEWFAGCGPCDQGFLGMTEADAVAAWNTRASDNRRCGDCVHWQSPLAEEDPGYCRRFDIVPDRDFFCADFTKREGEDG